MTYHRAPHQQPHRRLRDAVGLVPLALLCLWATAARAQTTVQVPAGQPTIQAGISAANNGDTVLVAPGTYYENIDFQGKSITVTSSAGAASTTIDGGLINPVVTLGTQTNAPSVLNGFTIQRGIPAQTQFSQNGGGVVVVGSATVENNTVTNNESCGIDVATFGIVLIKANHVFHNGFVTTSGNASGCHIDGAGIDVISTISTNVASPATTISGNLVEDNAGTGISGNFEGQTMAVLANIVRNNDESGIAVLSLFGPGVIANNLIYGNLLIGISANYYSPSTLSIVNNILYANGGPANNTSINATELLVTGAGVNVVNNVIDHTSSAASPMLLCNPDPFSPLPVAFDHNDIYNSATAVTNSGCLTTGYGNRSENPLFSNTIGGDFSLLTSSPEIDSGNNSAPNLPSTDLNDNPRIQDATGKGYPVVDLGAYEASGVQDLSPTIATLVPCSTTPQTGTNLILTASFVSPLGTPSGQVSLYMDLASSPYATINLGPTGSASFTVQTIAAGLHSFVASYSGTNPFTPAISVALYIYAQSAPSPCGQATATSTTLTSSLNPANYGQSVIFTASVANASTTSGLPTGSVTFSDGATALATQTLTSGSSTSATASFTSSTLSAGSHTITATYVPATGFSASTGQVVEIINPIPSSTALTAAPNPALLGQSVTFTASVTNTSTTPGSPTGSVTFSDGATILATQTLTSTNSISGNASFTTSTLSVGTHTITAAYVLTAGFSASSGQVVEIINLIPSSTTLTAAPNPAFLGQSVTLTAAATGPSTTPAGSVTFYDGATTLTTLTVDATGHASFTTATLAVSTHNLTAAFSGNSIYSTSTSQSFAETIQPDPADFTISLASPTLTIQTQHHLTTTVTLTSLSGFADSLALTCANLPTYLTCRLTPATASLTANATATASLYLDTDSVLGYARNRAMPIPNNPLASPFALSLLLSPFGLFAAFARRRSAQRPLRLLVLLLAAISFALAGCGTIILPADIPPSTPPGVYTIPIVAAGAAAGLTHTAQLTLTVTP